MYGLKARLERLERATAEVRCVWLYVGWGGRPGVAGAGDGVDRVFVPTLPAVLPAVLRYPDRGGAEVSATAAWALEQLALSPRQRALSAAARSTRRWRGCSGEPPRQAAPDGTPWAPLSATVRREGHAAMVRNTIPVGITPRLCVP